MRIKQHQNWTFALASSLLLGLVQPVLAEQDPEAVDSKPVVDSEGEASAGYVAPHQFGGACQSWYGFATSVVKPLI